jgi:predicted DNA-binding protein (UPF0251 family)
MSPRPKRFRRLKEPPHVKGFLPDNDDWSHHGAVNLLYEEFEALRLADYEGLSQLEASKRLDVSRPTFTRIYDSALKKIAKALVEQKRLVIGGGNVVFNERWFQCKDCQTVFKEKGDEGDLQSYRCPVCGSDQVVEIQEVNFSGEPHHGFRHHGHHGQGGGMGAEGFCVCPKCDHKVSHRPGIPCNTLLCPHCNIRLIREGSAHHQRIMEMKNKNKRKL